LILSHAKKAILCHAKKGRKAPSAAKRLQPQSAFSDKAALIRKHQSREGLVREAEPLSKASIDRALWNLCG
jgi:hypothetical protein